MELIIPGNKNINTIQNVIYFVNEKFEGRITKVLFLDMEESLVDKDGNLIESKRNEITRKYLTNNIKIESVMLNKENLHNEVPDLLSNELKIYKEDEIIVDTTNGTKFVSNILYASASLSKIKNIIFVNVPYDKFKELPENINKDEVFVELFSPIENVDMIGKHSYFEIFYYRELETELIEDFKNYEFTRSFLPNLFGLQLNAAITNYFLGNYSETITTVGQLSEELAYEVGLRIKKIAKGNIKGRDNEITRDFSSAVTFLRINFCETIRNKKDKDLLDYEVKYKELQTLDKLLDVIRVYRNISTHPYDFLRNQDEARIILNTFIYIIKLINGSGVLHECISQSTAIALES